MGVSTFSLWLVPTQNTPTCLKIQAEIALLKDTVGGPLFVPHVTLVGGVEGSQEDVLARAGALAASKQRMFVQFADIEAGTTFFQCVYLRCNKELNLNQTAMEARKAFNLDMNAPYTPHCSLLYSDIDSEKRQSTVKGLQDRLYGDMNGYGSLLMETGFWAESIEVWETPGDDLTLESWHKIQSFPLSGP